MLAQRSQGVSWKVPQSPTPPVSTLRENHNSIIKKTSTYAKDRGKVCIAAKMVPSKKSPLVGQDNIFGADGYMERDTASTILRPAALRAAREFVNDNARISLTVIQSKAKSDRCPLPQRKRMDSHSQYYLCLNIADRCAGDTWRGECRYTRYTTFPHRFARQPALVALSHLHPLSYVALSRTIHDAVSGYRGVGFSIISRAHRHVWRIMKKL